STSVTSADVFSAVVKLGIADSVDVDSLRRVDRTWRLNSDSSSSSRMSNTPTRRITADSLNHLHGLPRGITGAATDPDSGYYVFGLQVFAHGTTQFEPNLAGPVDENYRLGPGDQLVLVLTGDEEKAYTLDVTRDGFVVIPQVGQLQVANLTMGQL